MNKAQVLKELQKIPSIGKACALDMWNIGIRDIAGLKNQNPQELYLKLNEVTGTTHDICMLYTFRCAVYFASTKTPDPKKLKWWYWKEKMFKE